MLAGVVGVPGIAAVRGGLAGRDADSDPSYPSQPARAVSERPSAFVELDVDLGPTDAHDLTVAIAHHPPVEARTQLDAVADQKTAERLDRSA